MSRLTDSSELQEAIGLFQDLLENQGSVGAPAGSVGRNLETGVMTGPAIGAPSAGTVTQALPSPPPRVDEIEGEFRGDRLENVLFAMCRRGGFSGAVVSDSTGLPLAAYNSPVDSERIAAFASVLGHAMGKAEEFLEQRGAEYISMDINYEDKIVVRRFGLGKIEMFLLVLCSQAMDERAEVEMSIEQIVSVLG